MKNASGFSLVEILIVITSIGFLGLLLANIPSSVSLIGKAKHQSLVREIASKQIEDKRTIQYINLINGSEEVSDYRLNSLSESSGQVTISDCGSLCTNEEEAKKVEVVINWKESGKDQEVKFTTLISKGGLNQ